jgi:hypothetical protein
MFRADVKIPEDGGKNPADLPTRRRAGVSPLRISSLITGGCGIR